MKARLFILCLLLLVLGQPFTFGKSKKGKNKSEKEMIASIDSLQKVIDSLKIKLTDRDSVAITNQMTIDSLERVIIDSSFSNNQRMNLLRDSLTQEIETRDREITLLQSNIGFADTMIVRTANLRLFEKFDKTRVDRAISYFDRIYDNNVKSYYSTIQKLLRTYESAYREFQSILKQAQNDIERTSPFVVDEYKERYVKRIQSMSYYRQYYESDWNIRYLNGRIKEALECLQNHSYTKPADFSSLID